MPANPENSTPAPDAHVSAFAQQLGFLARERPSAETNDNFGNTEGDKWRWLIERLKGVHMPLAIYAAQKRLSGMGVHVFCDRLTEIFHAKDELWAAEEADDDFATWNRAAERLALAVKRMADHDRPC